MSIFQNEAIRVLIDYKWPLVKKYTVILLFIPFLIYLATFIAFSNVFNGQITSEGDNENYRNGKLALMILLYIMSLYSLLSEGFQLRRQKIHYFESIWNFLDIILPILIVVVVSHHMREHFDSEYIKPNFLYTVHSISSLFIWIKFLYFLRIFSSTGYLVRMLNTVIWDMKVFLLILLIIYLGFGEAFLRLSEGSTSDAAFINDYGHSMLYSFRMSLGDFSTDTFDNTV